MAAAGYAAVNDGSNAQILYAAERALEPHLGLACDPVGGRMQDPCIERNAKAGAIAYTSAAIAAIRMPDPPVGLDRDRIYRRWTGAARWRDATRSRRSGGVSVNVAEC